MTKNGRARIGRLGGFGALVAMLVWVLHPVSVVWACGGLFCNNAQPVNQVAERIIFAKNDDGTITAVIEILYEGPSEKFAWVLPMPAGDVEVGVSSKQALDAADAATNPTYSLNTAFEPCATLGSSPTGVAGTGAFASAGAGGAATGGTNSAPPAVSVIASGVVGPYDYVRIEVADGTEEPTSEAVDWLEDNDYDVTGLGVDTLRPYLEQGMTLLAFRLTKGNNSGSIRPVMLTYRGETPSIPIRPTAAAAAQDMGVKVWVLGESRALPTSFLHVELNEAMIDWFNPNASYNDVVIAAANEAGGQGFVTEYSGPSTVLRNSIFPNFYESNLERLSQGQFATMESFLTAAISYFGTLDGFLDVMSDPAVVPLREGATAEGFLACPSCYFQVDVPVRNDAYPSTPHDAENDPLLQMNVPAFLDALEKLVLEPLRATQKMFDTHAQLTRFYTTLSPDEMTVDPDFDFNPALEDVSNQHRADQLMLCNAPTEWRITLPQGIRITGNGRTWPVGKTSGLPAALRIVQLGTSADGVQVIEDKSAIVGAALAEAGTGDADGALANAMQTSPDAIVPVEKGAGYGAPINDEEARGDVSNSAAGCSVGPRSSGGAGLGLLLLGALAVWSREQRRRGLRLG